MDRFPTAVLLCAGVGRRLGAGDPQPKVMLRFGGKSLIERHLTLLAALPIAEVVIVTGFMRDVLEAHVRALGPSVPVRFLPNTRFREGSVVSCACAAPVLRGGGPVLLMDGDVLYDARMLARLEGDPGVARLLFDRGIEPGDEPVKICLDERGRIVDFRKVPANPGVAFGESVGFFRFPAAMAAMLADRAEDHAGSDGAHLEYEEAIRDMILADPDRFTIADVSDLPWTEIDFPEDVARARDEILPQLEA